ncbi:MAG TPA: hypothetical protein VGH58_01285 [Solirubrobacterales bacterium]|jgi:hypothetical protein
MDQRRSAQFGKAVVDVGTPDRGQNDERTDAIDAVANVLHYLDSVGEEDPTAILASAVTHYYAEKEGGL